MGSEGRPEKSEGLPEWFEGLMVNKRDLRACQGLESLSVGSEGLPEGPGKSIRWVKILFVQKQFRKGYI